MSVVSGKLRFLTEDTVAFMCPGCEELHVIKIGNGRGPRWGFDGDTERPTFNPSIRVSTGHYVIGEHAGKWCDRSGGTDPCECNRCHSFVRDGRIEFLSDSTHALAGRTVELPAMEESPRRR